MVEQEKHPIINHGMPCFEWTPGVVIEDMYETEEERELTVANRDMHEEIDRHSNLENIEDETSVGEYKDIGVYKDEVVELNDDDSLIVIREDNIISEEESFVEQDEDAVKTNEDEIETDRDEIYFTPEEEEVVVVASIDDADATSSNTRPRRVNAGAGVQGTNGFH